jgi:hypothetical protein
MAFLDNVLQTPSYGWRNAAGDFSKPSAQALLREFFSRLNIFRDKKNWLPFFSWLKVLQFWVVCRRLYLWHDTAWHTRYHLVSPLLHTQCFFIPKWLVEIFYPEFDA